MGVQNEEIQIDSNDLIDTGGHRTQKTYKQKKHRRKNRLKTTRQKQRQVGGRRPYSTSLRSDSRFRNTQSTFKVGTDPKVAKLQSDAELKKKAQDDLIQAQRQKAKNADDAEARRIRSEAEIRAKKQVASLSEADLRQRKSSRDVEVRKISSKIKVGLSQKKGPVLRESIAQKAALKARETQGTRIKGEARQRSRSDIQEKQRIAAERPVIKRRYDELSVEEKKRVLKRAEAIEDLGNKKLMDFLRRKYGIPDKLKDSIISDKNVYDIPIAVKARLDITIQEVTNLKGRFKEERTLSMRKYENFNNEITVVAKPANVMQPDGTLRHYVTPEERSNIIVKNETKRSIDLINSETGLYNKARNFEGNAASRDSANIEASKYPTKATTDAIQNNKEIMNTSNTSKQDAFSKNNDVNISRIEAETSGRTLSDKGNNAQTNINSLNQKITDGAGPIPDDAKILELQNSTRTINTTINKDKIDLELTKDKISTLVKPTDSSPGLITQRDTIRKPAADDAKNAYDTIHITMKNKQDEVNILINQRDTFIRGYIEYTNKLTLERNIFNFEIGPARKNAFDRMNTSNKNRIDLNILNQSRSRVAIIEGILPSHPYFSKLRNLDRFKNFRDKYDGITNKLNDKNSSLRNPTKKSIDDRIEIFKGKKNESSSVILKRKADTLVKRNVQDVRSPPSYYDRVTTKPKNVEPPVLSNRPDGRRVTNEEVNSTKRARDNAEGLVNQARNRDYADAKALEYTRTDLEYEVKLNKDVRDSFKRDPSDPNDPLNRSKDADEKRRKAEEGGTELKKKADDADANIKSDEQAAAKDIGADDPDGFIKNKLKEQGEVDVEIKKLKDEKDGIDTEINNKAKEKSGLDEENGKLPKDLEEARNRMKDAEDEYNRRNKEYNDEKAKYENLKKRLGDSEPEVIKQKRLLEELTVKKNKASDDFDAARKKLKDAEDLEIARKKKPADDQELKKKQEDLEAQKKKNRNENDMIDKLKQKRSGLWGLLGILIALLGALMLIIPSTCDIQGVFGDDCEIDKTDPTDGTDGTGETEETEETDGTGGTGNTGDTSFPEKLRELAPVIIPAVLGVGAVTAITSAIGSSNMENNMDGYADGYKAGQIFAYATVKKGAPQADEAETIDDAEEAGQLAQVGGKRIATVAYEKKDTLDDDETMTTDEVEEALAEEEFRNEEPVGENDPYADELPTNTGDGSALDDLPDATPGLPYPVPTTFYQSSYNEGYIQGYQDTRDLILGLKTIQETQYTNPETADENEQYTPVTPRVEEEDMEMSAPAPTSRNTSDEQTGGSYLDAKKWIQKMERAIKKKTRKNTDLFQEYKNVMSSLKSENYHTSTLKMGK
jgi:hypothetical protein